MFMVGIIPFLIVIFIVFILAGISITYLLYLYGEKNILSKESSNDTLFTLFAGTVGITLLVIHIITFTTCYLSTSDIVKFLEYQEYQIEIISKDKAIIHKKGDNDFSYIDITIKDTIDEVK